MEDEIDEEELVDEDEVEDEEDEVEEEEDEDEDEDSMQMSSLNSIQGLLSAVPVWSSGRSVALLSPTLNVTYRRTSEVISLIPSSTTSRSPSFRVKAGYGMAKLSAEFWKLLFVRVPTAISGGVAAVLSDACMPRTV